MRLIFAIAVVMLSGCVTTKEIYLADGTKGHNISCGGAIQNFSACLEKAGEICGAQGFDVVDQQGATVPFTTATANYSANRSAAQGSYYGQSGNIVTRNLFVRCK